jgi:hypothetical protein
VKPRNLKEGDLVLKELKAPVFDPRGKFKPNWAGPYVIKTLFSGEWGRAIPTNYYVSITCD